MSLNFGHFCTHEKLFKLALCWSLLTVMMTYWNLTELRQDLHWRHYFDVAFIWMSELLSFRLYWVFSSSFSGWNYFCTWLEFLQFFDFSFYPLLSWVLLYLLSLFIPLVQFGSGNVKTNRTSSIEKHITHTELTMTNTSWLTGFPGYK